MVILFEYQKEANIHIDEKRSAGRASQRTQVISFKKKMMVEDIVDIMRIDKNPQEEYLHIAGIRFSLPLIVSGEGLLHL